MNSNYNYSQSSNMLNASRLKVLKAREDHINVSVMLVQQSTLTF